jgi:hypothetical protein
LNREKLLWRRELPSREHGDDDEFNDEFLVKFKRLSYHKCEWMSRKTIMELPSDKQVSV